MLSAMSDGTAPILTYYAQRPYIQSQADGGVLITIPSRRTFFGYALKFAVSCCIHPYLYALIPLFFTAGVLIYFRYNKPSPRAIIRITRALLTIEEYSDTSLGTLTAKHTWPTQEVAELRANRYGRGLYFRIAGKVNLDLLTDIPDDWRPEMDAAIAQTLQHFQSAGNSA